MGAPPALVMPKETRSTVPSATLKVHKLKRDEGTLLSGQEPEKSMTQGPQHLLNQETEKAIMSSPIYPDAILESISDAVVETRD